MPARRQPKHLINLALLSLLTCSAVARSEPLAVLTAALELNPENPGERQAGRLDYIGGLILASSDARFGGYSGLEVDGDGRGLWAVSDTGHWLRLELATDAAGRPVGVRGAELLPLADAEGRPITAKFSNDAEALRRTVDGRWLVAFERSHRIWRYDAPGGAAVEALPLPTAVATQPANGGLEAMAELDDGGLLLLSEELTTGENKGAAWVWQGGAWHDAVWPLADDFRPTDATALPGTGDVVVLERYFTPLVGPKARLRLLPVAQLQPGRAWQPQMLAEWARPVSVDNMEGLDARRAEDGSLWLYLISDDNRNSLQRSLLMVFRLRPD